MKEAFLNSWANARYILPISLQVKFCSQMIVDFNMNEVDIQWEAAKRGWTEVAVAFKQLEN